MVAGKAKEYLESRGYTQALLAREELEMVNPGEGSLLGVPFFTEVASVAMVCRSMSEDVAGIHLVGVGQKDYRTYQAKDKGYLPTLYGDCTDRDILFETREMVLVEGVFDRVPIKKAFPEKAVFARLTKGATGQLVELLRVYCDLMWAAFDMDEYGMRAGERAQRVMHWHGVRVETLNYPAKDPGKLGEGRTTKEIRTLLDPQFQALGF